jgi:hypothetical protein
MTTALCSFGVVKVCQRSFASYLHVGKDGLMHMLDVIKYANH